MHEGTQPDSNSTIDGLTLDCTVRNLAVTGVRNRDSQTDTPAEQIVEVIELKPNPDYAKTAPKGGTGKGICIPRIMRSFIPFILSALLLAPLAALSAVELPPPLDAASWKPRQGLVPAERLPAAYEARAEEGLRFSLSGALAKGKQMRWERPWTTGEHAPDQWLVLEYRAQWANSVLLALLADDAAGKPSATTLVSAQDLVRDGLWHRLVVQRPYPSKPTALRVLLDSNDSRSWFEVRRLEWVASPDKAGPALAADKQPSQHPDLHPIPLAFNDRYALLLQRPYMRVKDDTAVLDGGAWFTQDHVSLEGVPFRVESKPDANNLITPPPEPKENNDLVDHFGVQAPRRAVAPVSRDSRITVPVGREVSEVFLMLAAELPGRELGYFSGRSPTTLDTVEEFAVELIYESGVRDLAFPYSIQDGRHLIRRALGVYAVPATGAKLKEVVLHNRKLGARVHLAAMTVNTGKQRLFPSLAEEPKLLTAAPGALDPSLKPFARREGDLLKLGNAHYGLTLDASKLMSPVALTHRRLNQGAARVAPAPLLEMEVAGKAIPPQQWKLESIKELPLGFEVNYRSTDASLPVRCTVTARTDDSPEARLALSMSNEGAQPVDAEIRFPVLRGLQLGEAADLRCFFPQYRNALGGERATYYAYAGVAFPVQFFDVFDERTGAGVWLRTEDLADGQRNYFLSKQDDGASLHVEYPGLTTRLPSGDTTAFPVTTLGFHAGDWRAAADRYRDWLATWYRPVKAQDKAWLRESFWLLAEITDGVPAPYSKLPPWYAPEKKKVLFRDILAEWERKSGHKPDILHLWGWTYDPKTIQHWGEYGGRDYHNVGGQPAFKEAIADTQNNLGVPMSLYINATLCSKDTPAGQRLADKALQLPDGKPFIRYRDTYCMCHATPEWIGHQIQTYQRLVRETGAKMLYVDQQATVQDIVKKTFCVCFNPTHGHPVPNRVNETDHRFIRALREAVPGEVALYGEFPYTDTTTQFYDSAIHYYFHRGAGKRFSPIFDAESNDRTDEVALNLYRFLFPKLMHLDLPLGITYNSWHPLKFTFFNGEAIYDSFWNIDESRGHAFITRAYELKKRFKDCFAGDAPEMLVPTERASVYANRFPGKDRTVWTLYNARPNTVRGEVLVVPHHEGATYRDVWTDKEIHPELRDGQAVLSLELGPQSIGCVSQTIRR